MKKATLANSFAKSCTMGHFMAPGRKYSFISTKYEVLPQVLERLGNHSPAVVSFDSWIRKDSWDPAMPVVQQVLKRPRTAMAIHRDEQSKFGPQIPALAALQEQLPRPTKCAIFHQYYQV